MLVIKNLCKNYGPFTAVKNLNLRVPKGDLFGFVGPNGAGKTTTMRITCGLLTATSGEVIVNDRSWKTEPKEVKKCIGYVPDFFGVYDNLKVDEYLEFYGSLNGMTYKEIKPLIGDLLQLVNLSDKVDFYVDTLSRGMKQRLCVARALLHNPELLILDEPSSGLDPRARVEMKELLMNLQSMGKTIIISSHILSELSEMCNSIGIMNLGRIVTAGTIDNILGRGKENARVIIDIKGDTAPAAIKAKEFPTATLESVRENQIIISNSGTDEDMNHFIGNLISDGIIITGFRKEENSLETLFMQLTGAENQNAG